jgi:alanyl-tRNA synthetase
MQYKLDPNMKWAELPQRNVDFGGGLERVVAVCQGVSDNYETDLFKPIIEKIEEISSQKFSDEELKPHFRIIADHIRASTFLLADEVIPSNKDQGYILRRLIRRAIRHGRFLDIDQNFTRELAQVVVDTYKDVYPHLNDNIDIILNEIDKEEIKFRRTLERGLKELGKITGRGEQIDGSKAFWIYETYGFPFEMIQEELAGSGKIDIDKLKREFEESQEKHKNMSRTASAGKFKGGLADHSDQTTRLHTAHHLLLASLQKVLGPHVHQKGSNITNARLRIDFTHNEKLTPEQIERIENMVNDIIDHGFTVEKKIMPIEEATKLGAEMEFKAKYTQLVNVYFIKDPETGEIFSKELCAGPHVENTKELAKSGKFKIIKEESSGAGTRRIKATLG